MKNLLLSLSVFGIACFCFSCGNDGGEDYCVDQNVLDEAIIQNYIDTAGLTNVQVTEEGVHYIVEVEGDGPRPDATSRVTVHYEGFLLDGTKFDSSYDRGQSASFSLTGVIPGWTIGIPQFRKNGSGVLIIPSCLAYRRNPPFGSPIGEDDVLLFNIRLLEVN
ncbi:MAG: FKBP-type peptidyl-prolyl cis-trans isomerase [Bacteroidota bacterium]